MCHQNEEQLGNDFSKMLWVNSVTRFGEIFPLWHNI